MDICLAIVTNELTHGADPARTRNDDIADVWQADRVGVFDGDKYVMTHNSPRLKFIFVIGALVMADRFYKKLSLPETKEVSEVPEVTTRHRWKIDPTALPVANQAELKSNGYTTIIWSEALAAIWHKAQARKITVLDL